MTLVMTVISTRGAWQCSDHRLSVRERSGKLRTIEDLAAKSVSINCSDGSLLACFTGLAKVGKLDCIEWLRASLRGDGRTVQETIETIRTLATRDLAQYLKRYNLPHVFQFAVMLNGDPWAVLVTNVDIDTRTITDQFSATSLPAKDVPKIMVHGCVDALTQKDRKHLERVAYNAPRQENQFHTLLANINSRAARSGLPGANGISEACVTTYMPPSGEPFSSIAHDPNNKRPRANPRAQGTLLFGVDLTPMTEVVMEFAKRSEEGNPMSDEEFDQRSKQAAEESVRPK